MNEVFRSAADQTRQRLPQLSANQEACRLYRHALKTLSSWAIDREIFLDEATKLRARFDESRGCSAAQAGNATDAAGAGTAGGAPAGALPEHLPS